jgi:hypothetical protein
VDVLVDVLVPSCGATASRFTMRRWYGPPCAVCVVSAFARFCAMTSIRIRCADKPLAEMASVLNIGCGALGRAGGVGMDGVLVIGGRVIGQLTCP